MREKQDRRSRQPLRVLLTLYMKQIKARQKLYWHRVRVLQALGYIPRFSTDVVAESAHRLSLENPHFWCLLHLCLAARRPLLPVEGP